MNSDFPRDPFKEELITDSFWDEQSDVSGKRRYKPYSFTQGLRKAMGHLQPQEIQEVHADRSFNVERDTITAISNSPVSGIMSGSLIKRKQFELEFDRGEQGVFPWTDVRSTLGQSETVHDLPIRRLVVRFESEEFEKEWRDTIEDAIEVDNVPMSWIESPFFAVLESNEPGDRDARDNLRDLHEEFYYKPMLQTDENYEGMDWSLRTLDLEEVWSLQAFTRQPDPILTIHYGDRQYEWTPHRLEKYIMNYFNPSEDYTGALRNSEFASLWRRTYSRDVTDTKQYEWEEDEEWIQTT